jgi:hypothetical protein
MKINNFYFFWVLFFAGCTYKKIEISTEYIINENWDEHANAIEISRQKIKKDSFINPFSDLNQTEILNKLENDSSFIFFANAKYNGERYLTRKIYFNKDNGFLWLTDKYGDTKVKTIGNLQSKTWYKFSHLVTYPYYIYVYVDSSNNVQRFNVNLANY